MKRLFSFFIAIVISTIAQAQTGVRVSTQNGVLEGTEISGIKVFKGIPFAQPPVGELRWKAPKPVEPWTDVRQCKEYGPNPMQEALFGDMNFGTDKMSEDCLYLNIWTPAKDKDDRLPVVIYFNGGGLMAGSGSEPRYAGMSMAREGIIGITANYREGIFGFFAHPQLSAETPYKGSGNYGFMDQQAAIRWVKDNIKAFGGDPARITIVGESAGSMSVSALMASPLSEGLFSQAMGSSGSVLGYTPIATLKEAELKGKEMMKQLGCKSLKEMRLLPADTLMKRAAVKSVPIYNIDNYFMPCQPSEIYEKGEQMKVPLLVGGNSLEMTPMAFFGGIYMNGRTPTMDDVRLAASTLFGEYTDEMLNLYGFTSGEDVLRQPGIDFSNDRFISYSTWRWADAHRRTGGKPVYRYMYCKERPRMVVEGKEAGLAGGVRDKDDNAPQLPEVKGAVHSADIEYAMGNLPTNRIYDWQPEDYMVSDIFMGYYVNFIKTGNPNGLGLPEWKTYNPDVQPALLIIDTDTRMTCNDKEEKRYRRMNEIFKD
ncbi:MAG: carboxylesterase/lipase family protein [Prevotella sp.]